MNVSDCIKGNVFFLYYRDLEFLYKCENGFEFVVPLDDTKGATFKAVDKGMYFMRWIRKQIAENERRAEAIKFALKDQTHD